MFSTSQTILIFLLLFTFFIPAILSPAPQTKEATTTLLPVAHAASTKESAAPTRLTISSIKLSSPIVPVGLTKDGKLDVPGGKTNNVGWYAKGTVPGEEGAAVLDAHVFAAFSKLKNVDNGDRIAVEMSDGTEREFVVTKTKVYKLADLSPQELFERQDGRHLHLITCAGSPTADGKNYTHRLVVYATLAQ